MSYVVVIEKQVQKQLLKITRSDYNKVVAALQSLADNPRPQGYKN